MIGNILISDIEHLSCTCWPSVYLLWKNGCTDHLPFFNQNVCGFCCWDVGSFICWIWTLYYIYIYNVKIFPPIPQVASSLCRLLSLLCRSFLVWGSLYFSFNKPLLLFSSPKNLLPRPTSSSLSPLVFLGVLQFQVLNARFSPFWVAVCVWYRIGVQFHSFACGC